MTRPVPIWWLVSGAGLGAASMYFLDPVGGRRRRHEVVDRARSAVTEVEELARKAERDLENRARGVSARARGASPARHAKRGILSQGSPERRLLQGGAAGLLSVWGLARGGLIGASAVVAGASLLANVAFARQNGRICVQKTLTIDAPIDEVFRFWSQLDNFPRFMEHVLEVRIEGSRSHWRVAGPAGVPVEWDAELTDKIENRKIAWRSLEGSDVEHAGEVHFERAGDNATRISVHMAYRPPGGALGHAAAGFLLGDPKRLMDEDLLRLKSLLEEGKTRVHGEEILRPEATR